MRAALLACLVLSLACAARAAEPVNFLFADSDSLATHARLIERPDIAGVQIVYTWKSLEPAQDRYDFSQIEADLAFLQKRGKQLFVQLQDRFFVIEARNVPLVIQYNKQDLPRELILPAEELSDALNFRGVPEFSADALHGPGVFETLRSISELVLKRLSTGANAGAGAR